MSSTAKSSSWKVLAQAAGPVAILTLAGCAVGPKYQPPEVKLNPTWSEPTDKRVETAKSPDAGWWKSFNDPALNRLVELAFQQNLSLQASGLRIMEARARLGYAIGQRYPQFQAVTGAAAITGFSNVPSNDVLSDHHYTDYHVSFDASWEIDFWRRYSSTVNAEQAGYFATVADRDNAMVSLVAEVARTYAVIRTFEVLIAQTQANVKVQEEGLGIAQARFQNGATSELDVQQSKTLLESTRTTVPQLEASRQQAENALATLVGSTSGSLAGLLRESADIPSPPDQVAVSIPAEVLRRRADIRSAELLAMAQCERIGIAKADLYPRLALFGSIGARGGDANSDASSFLSTETGFLTFGPRLLWPVLNYGRLKNNIRIEDARFQQSLVNYKDVVIRAGQEVEDALAGFRRNQEASIFARRAAEAARQSVNLAFVQYREGAVDFQRVLDAQRAQLQEENTFAQVRSAVATSLIALYKALGGGWEVQEGQPFVNEATQRQMQERTNWGDFFNASPTPPASEASQTNSRR